MALPQNIKRVNILFVTVLSCVTAQRTLEKKIAHTTGVVYKGVVLFDNLERQGAWVELCLGYSPVSAALAAWRPSWPMGNRKVVGL